MQVYDETRCELGEGPLWHPEREQLFWFDINGHRLHTRSGDGARHWQFDEYVSAAGWIDRNRLLIASETALFDFDLRTGRRRAIAPLEANDPVTRCNDGRADPRGGFWIGTMGKQKEAGAGAIYRYHMGTLRRLFAPLTIPNAICFAPNGRTAYFADTPEGKVWRVALTPDGWPDGKPDLFLELPGSDYRPDGAVVDTAGTLWIAQYGHGKVCTFSPDADALEEFNFPASRTTCPAFGGPELQTLFVTTAWQQMEDPGPRDGQTFALRVAARGQHEHRVIL